jgi:uncharacterized phage protein (TIGR02218 family)
MAFNKHYGDTSLMKTISSALLSTIQQGAFALTVLVLVQRTDGLVLGFTSWDLPLIFNGVTYWPTVSLASSAIKVNSDLTTDQIDIYGTIDSTLITEADLDAGRYDEAQVTIMRVNPLDLTQGSINDLTGYSGQLDFGEEHITLAVNSLGTLANQQFGDVITPLCRVQQLGDYQCKVNIASFQHASTVVSVTSQSMITFTDTQVAGYYNYGMVRFASLVGNGGPNYNLNMEVKNHTIVSGQALLELVEPMPFPVGIGNSVILEAGCDRKPLTCRSKFNNLVNIHAEPYVPGNDYLSDTGRPPS